MENTINFSYNYSARQNKEAEAIRKKYVIKEESKLEQLKKLDGKVRKPADIFAYIFGSIAAIIMGSGMSLIMTDIGQRIGITETMLPGIVIGVIGLFMALVNYPIFRSILGNRRNRYANKIFALSEEIIGGNNNE